MKKRLLFLIILLVPFMVKANEDLSFGWAYGLNENAAYATEEKEGYSIVTFGENMPIYQIDKSGGTLVKKYDTIDSYKEKYTSATELLYYARAKADGLLIRTLEDGSIVNVNVASGEWQVCSQGTASDPSTCTGGSVYDLSDEDFVKYIGDYAVVFIIHNSEPNSYHYGYIDNNYVGVTKFDPTANKYYFSVYNSGLKEIIKIEYKNYEEYYTAAMSEDGIYIIKTERNYISKSIKYTLTKYSPYGQQVYSKVISQLVLNDYINTSNFMQYTAQFINHTQGGLVIKLNKDSAAGILVTCMNESTDSGETAYTNCVNAMNGNNTVPPNTSDPASIFVKLNIQYDVSISVDGPGIINTPSNPQPGDKVTLSITPDKGYVLGEIIITDEFGDVLSTNETFTMPNSMVYVTAKFIKNPDTGSFVPVILLMGGLLIACIALIVSEHNKKIKMIS